MGATESSEAQQTNDLYTVLNSKLFFDGKNILNSLHSMKKLKKVNVAGCNTNTTTRTSSKPSRL